MAFHRTRKQDEEGLGRRTFIADGIRWSAAMALAGAPATLKAGSAKKWTVREIIDLVIAATPGGKKGETVDTLKCGDENSEVTGVICTMFATVPVIREAIKRQANFIIAHEPTFYNHLDDKNWVPHSRVVQEKLDLLNRHQVAVWRCHDYWHAMNPDGITYGVVRAMGWEKYYQNNQPLLVLPPQPLAQIADQLKKALQIAELRVIGNPDMPCSRIALLPGAWGGQRQMQIVEEKNPDLLLVGEVHEWETAEYIRDRNALGHPTAMIDLGHGVSEEPGMDWMATWLSPQVAPVSVTHIPSGNPFIFL